MCVASFSVAVAVFAAPLLSGVGLARASAVDLVAVGETLLVAFENAVKVCVYIVWVCICKASKTFFAEKSS